MNNALTELFKQKLCVIDVEQNSPKWFELRRTKCTASETPIVMGLSPWSSPSQLALEKFGNKQVKQLRNVATAHGHKYEPIARSSFEHKYKLDMPATVLIRGAFMSSLDGWNRKQNEILEIKCPYMSNQSDTWVRACDAEVPAHYYAQIQHQLLVSGAIVCHFWVFDARRKKGIHITVKPNRDYYVRILLAWERFLKVYG